MENDLLHHCIMWSLFWLVLQLVLLISFDAISYFYLHFKKGIINYTAKVIPVYETAPKYFIIIIIITFLIIIIIFGRCWYDGYASALLYFHIPRICSFTINLVSF